MRDAPLLNKVSAANSCHGRTQKNLRCAVGCVAINRNSSFPIDNAQPSRLPPSEVCQRGPPSAREGQIAPRPASKNLQERSHSLRRAPRSAVWDKATVSHQFSYKYSLFPLWRYARKQICTVTGQRDGRQLLQHDHPPKLPLVNHWPSPKEPGSGSS